jgi:hypothetical protein
VKLVENFPTICFERPEKKEKEGQRLNYDKGTVVGDDNSYYN